MKEPALRNYMVAGNKPWSRQVFDERICRLPGKWHFVGSKEELTVQLVRELAPRYIFFLHWSWKVPDEILKETECVCFHMTDVPYGRGGSPLQNLILRGQQQTKVSALKMTETLDAGPVYRKADLRLEGSAEEIYLRANHLAGEMIELICHEQPTPVEQTGEVVIFKRRTPEESQIPESSSLMSLYDFIRMLDAEGYPQAFLCHGGFRYEFDQAHLDQNQIQARVKIIPISSNHS